MRRVDFNQDAVHSFGSIVFLVVLAIVLLSAREIVPTTHAAQSYQHRVSGGQ